MLFYVLYILYKKKELQVSQIPYSTTNPLDLSWVKKRNSSNTKAIIHTQASNVCGTIYPSKISANFVKKRTFFLIIDSAQTAGYLEINFTDLNLDALAFTGHKGAFRTHGYWGFITS